MTAESFKMAIRRRFEKCYGKGGRSKVGNWPRFYNYTLCLPETIILLTFFSVEIPVKIQEGALGVIGNFKINVSIWFLKNSRIFFN